MKYASIALCSCKATVNPLHCVNSWSVEGDAGWGIYVAKIVT